MNHTTEALAALDAVALIDPTAANSFLEIHRLTAAANVHAAIAQVEATREHTAIVSAFMATTVTSAQAKVLIGAFAGLNKIA